MIFTETILPGAFVIDPEKQSDQRGFFARSWCKNEFQAMGLNTNIVQCNISFNIKKATIRGMHYQGSPFEEAKLVRCTSGAICDVIIDLRANSPTRFQWICVELTALNHRLLYIPEGFAHGFQTLEDSSEVFYQMSEFYHPEYAQGIRWNDPLFNISWPVENPTLSEKDQQYPDYCVE